MTDQTSPTGQGYSTRSTQLLFVSCVSPDRSHPSGELAARYRDNGVEVTVLFENARNLRQNLKDTLTLDKLLAQGKFDKGLLNLNGSLSQLLAITAFARHNIPCSLWIMDSYPGCLRYVTRNWRFWWFPFYLASWIVKRRAHKIFTIDEEFVHHAPSSPAIRTRTQYVPLPTKNTKSSPPSSRLPPHTIGIIGNIESDWMRDDFPSFFDKAKNQGNRVLIATSRDIELPDQDLPNLEVVFPWRKEETERIFSKCDFILVPISPPRLVYSSPSKIIESYARGIQPLLMTDTTLWTLHKSRRIYQKCLHVDEFFTGIPAHSPNALQAFATHWIDTWDNVMAQTVQDLENNS